MRENTNLIWPIYSEDSNDYEGIAEANFMLHKMSWTIFRISFTSYTQANCLLSLDIICLFAVPFFFFFSINLLLTLLLLFFFFYIQSVQKQWHYVEIKKKKKKNEKHKTILVFVWSGRFVYHSIDSKPTEYPNRKAIPLYEKKNILFIFVSATITKPLCTCHFRNALCLCDSVLHD